MPEQEPSRFEAFKQGFSERLDQLKQGINRVKAIGEVAGLGVGISLGLVATAGAEEPPHNASIPVLEAESFVSTSATLNEATASDAQQDCVDAALAKPKIIAGPNIKYGSVAYPGDRRKQSTFTGGRLEPTSADCLPLVTREAPKVFFRMQRPKNHRAWIRTKPQDFLDNSTQQPIGDEGGKGQVFVETGPKSPFRDSKFRYRCTPGKGITHVQAVYKLKVDSAVDGSNLGQRTYFLPLKITPVPPSLVQGGGVPKAC